MNNICGNLIVAFISSFISAMFAFCLFYLAQKNERKRWLFDTYAKMEAEYWLNYRKILVKLRHTVLDDIQRLFMDGLEERIFLIHPLEYFNNIDKDLEEFTLFHNLLIPFMKDGDIDKFQEVEEFLSYLKTICSAHRYSLAYGGTKVQEKVGANKKSYRVLDPINNMLNDVVSDIDENYVLLDDALAILNNKILCHYK